MDTLLLLIGFLLVEVIGGSRNLVIRAPSIAEPGLSRIFESQRVTEEVSE
jgi:hypothetical protein